MDFRIADTFTDSLARLSSDELKAVKTTAFDLQMNPASPGMSFHKLDSASRAARTTQASPVRKSPGR
jgi:hypothetical protein